jgi:hypothetical protein
MLNKMAYILLNKFLAEMWQGSKQAAALLLDSVLVFLMQQARPGKESFRITVGHIRHQM